MSNYTKLMQQAAAGVGGGGFYPYTVDYSARFNDNDSPYLAWTPSVAGDRRTWGLSLWVKRGNLGLEANLLSCRQTGLSAEQVDARFNPSDQLTFFWATAASSPTSGSVTTSSVFRDPSAWLNVYFRIDTTQATAADRVRIYVNNVEQPLSSSTYPQQNAQLELFDVTEIVFFSRKWNNDRYFDGYASQVVVVEGQSLDPTSFGENKNGVWVPKNISGLTFGTNGFYLDFADSSNLGNDVSGNNNDFTSSGLTSSDRVPDTPTNNFCTLNPVAPVDLTTISDGSLVCSWTDNASATLRPVTGTMVIPRTGKWYFETYVEYGGAGGNNGSRVGICDLKDIMRNGEPLKFRAYRTSQNAGAYGIVSDLAPVTNTGSNITTTGRIQVAIDADAGKMWFGFNGTWESGDPAAGTSPAFSDIASARENDWIVYVGGYEWLGTLTRQTLDFGQSGFTYTPPTGYLALCTANLPEPTIGPNSDTTSDENFAPVLYTGNGTAIASGGKTISDLVFQPDFTWIKNRDAADNHMLFDAVRGATKYLSSDLDTAEVTDTESLASFTSTGFTLGNNVAVNTNAENYVAWNWKASGSGVTNTDGTITSTVSANTDAGFSIVTYTGNGTADSTIGHGLNAKPKLILVKNMSSASDWMVYSEDCTKDYYLKLNTTDAKASASNYWGGTGPTTSTFQIGSPPPSGYMTRTSTSAMSISGSGTQASPYSGYSTNHADNTQGVANFATAGGSGVLYWKVSVSSEAGYDFARLYVNGSLKVNISGGQSSTSSQTVDSGASISFRYFKDESVSAGSDTGTLNYLYLVPDPIPVPNNNGDNYVAYCFAEKESFSKFGSFTGNGSSTDGPFVYTGFRPAFLMLKRTDSTSNWSIIDAKRNTHNVLTNYLDPNVAAAESTNFNWADFTSNGFKLRGANTTWNVSGGSYIYMCFSENPFKYSNAR